MATEGRMLEYLDGARCELCERLIFADGTGIEPVCICRRDAAYDRNAEEVELWLEEHLPESDAKLNPAQRKERDMLLNAASQALGRSRRRASMGARSITEVRPNTGTPGTIEEFERANFSSRYDPRVQKYHRPSSKWTPKADAEVV